MRVSAPLVAEVARCAVGVARQRAARAGPAATRRGVELRDLWPAVQLARRVGRPRQVAPHRRGRVQPDRPPCLHDLPAGVQRQVGPGVPHAPAPGRQRRPADGLHRGLGRHLGLGAHRSQHHLFVKSSSSLNTSLLISYVL